ncbi:MAG: Thymidylate synthase ThyX [bacterium ADurb.Bin431]|nr:MAG: Thymidylate synthase ThyX [bacterium ADurb.Bin431]
MTVNLELPIRKEVLDHGWMQLEDCMGGDAAVIRGARICYQSEAKGPHSDERLIRRLMASEPKHNTVFEHAVFRWGVRCPIFVARQWMRHRIGSYNEMSLRYCAATKGYYTPAVGNGLSPETLAAYEAHMQASFALYEQLVAQGWEREQARGVLGLAVYTEFIWTVNAWSLMNWLYKRLDRHAQWEHRQYAEAALAIFHQAMPITASAFDKWMEPQ